MSANLSLSHPSPRHAVGMQSRPVSQAFCSSEQLPSCWRFSRRWMIGRVGRCDCFRSAVVLQHTSSSSRTNAITIAQSQHGTSQPTSNRRSTHGTTMEREEVLLVADRSTISSKIQMATVAAPPPFPPPQHQYGSPLLWIGLGVGISVFSWAAMRNKNYFPFRSSSPSSSPVGSSMTIASAIPPFPTETKEVVDKTQEVKEPEFSDANIDPLIEGNTARSKVPSAQSQEETSVQASSILEVNVVGFGGQRSKGDPFSTSDNGKVEPLTSMEMLERMIDGPQIQKMVFLYLPEELRDPVKFKRMIHLPPVRLQLQKALNNIGGEGLHMFKNMNSDLVKQQFGLTPEEAVGKILANPDIAASLQNTKVVEAIMDCSQNPLNITKYQHDEEVMNTLLTAAELFRGATNFSY